MNRPTVGPAVAADTQDLQLLQLQPCWIIRLLQLAASVSGHRLPGTALLWTKTHRERRTATQPAPVPARCFCHILPSRLRRSGAEGAAGSGSEATFPEYRTTQNMTAS